MNHAQKIFSIILGLIFFCLPAAAAMAADTENKGSMAPLNPAYIKYREDVRSGKQPIRFTPEGHALGLMPSPVDMSHTRGRRIFPDIDRRIFPSYYDLRKEGRLTPVKAQRQCGSCWTFAVYGSLESWILGKEGKTWDFSENNLKECHGFNVGGCQGGFTIFGISYLARGDGPVTEVDDPYNYTETGCATGLTPAKYVETMLMPPDRATPRDNANIKKTVMDYGAMFTSFLYAHESYNERENTYYHNESEYSNHAVCIVGWDDNKLVTGAPGRGAWLVRNSWGPFWGDGGYFYISYYDGMIGKENASFINAVKPHSRIYQYDSLGWLGSYGNGRDSAWGANIFTAVADETLTAVGIFAATVNTGYEIYIYNTFDGRNFSGLLGRKIGRLIYPGYYTIHLDSPIPLGNGDDFAVVVKFITPGYGYPVPIEYPEDEYSTTASANAGESYVSDRGGIFRDLTTLGGKYSEANVCIKAITDTPNPDLIPPEIEILSPTSDAAYIVSANSLNISGSASDNAGLTEVIWSNDRGGNGRCSGTTSWSASDVTVFNGTNVITVTAYDAAGNTNSDTLTVTYSSEDDTPPVVTILYPTSDSTYLTTSNSLSISGTAWDNIGVTMVDWWIDRDGEGVCSGTTSWSVDDIILYGGQYTITVTAYDAAGNSSSDTLTVNYKLPDTKLPQTKPHQKRR
jgi:C1A family cysteine protease